MSEYEYDRSPLRAALEGFMEEITPSEVLDPGRIVGKGRERRRRRQFGIAAGSTLAVLATAGSAFALGTGNHGKEAGPAAGPTTVTASAAPRASASALPGTPLTSGTTDGVAWKTSFTLAAYQGGPDQQACVHVWTSDGSTNPAACTVTVYPGFASGGDRTPEVMSNQPLAISAKLGVTGISTVFTTKVHITYAGGSFTLPTLSAGQHADQNNDFTAAVLPLADTAPSGRVTPIGPAGTGMTTDILIYATPTGQ
jgi:hypothetical protein